MSTQQQANRPYALDAGEGTPMVWFSSTITRKASSPAIGITEVLMSPGEEPPLHVHKNEDEWLYVLEGAVTFHVGGENHLGRAGAFVSFPRGIPHTFSIETPRARFLTVNTPGGFERMFELAPKTSEEAVRALAAFGMDVVGPHPRQAATAA
ncbi:MAG TPA: cupin domain-containing protein [Bryobacteraceae bacterium]|nr:cupin domain-containing protein [Bryobacteraceae bacterium]